ncbi:hypothetical protein J4481_01490 [Candidatus Pacearchaeota archaeon]|nr:hypothetical protein [Candidatus Pacearchaeota archaeon]
MTNKNNYLYIGIAVVVVIVLAIVFISNSNNNSQNEVTCNSPYIKVGISCCLDQNYNSVCDDDEKLGNFNFILYASSDYESLEGYSWEDNVPFSEATLITRKSGILNGNDCHDVYGGISLFIDTNPDNKQVGCEIKEYYGNTLNEVINRELTWSEWHLDTGINLNYEIDKKPEKVKYVVKCKRAEDQREVTKEFTINLNYNPLDENLNIC